MLDQIISKVNDVMYSYILIILLVAGGLYFSLSSNHKHSPKYRQKCPNVI